jgi:hypothetical protein
MKRKNKCVSKKKYGTVDLVNVVIKRAYKERNVKLRYYECPVCLDFHLTSKNADSIEFKKYDKEIIEKQNNLFEILFRKCELVLVPSKRARKRRRLKLNKKIRQQANSVAKPKVKHGFTEEAIPLNKQKEIFRQIKENNLLIQYLFSEIDYSRNMWITKILT